MGIRAVLFDAVGTVMYPEPSVAAVYCTLGRRFGSDMSGAEIGARFPQALARQDELDRTLHCGRTSQQREAARWRQVVADVFDDVPDTQPLFDALWRHFACAGSWRLFHDAADAWKAMSAAGLKIGIASNWDARLLGICGELRPLDAARTFVSSLVGWRKPCPQFFQAVEAELGMKPDEIALVGDDVEVDYLAARAAGWRALHLAREGSVDARVASADQVHSLIEVAGALV